MFFGRRKHAAPTPVPAATASPQPAVPELTDEAIFAAVERTMQAAFGENGEWTVARRSTEQTDQIFHEVLVHSLAAAVTASVTAARGAGGAAASAAATTLAGERQSDDGVAGGPLGLLRAPRQNPWLNGAPVSESGVVGTDNGDEPAAFSWEPAPITRWADLKRPVTGPVAIVESATGSEEKAA